MITISTAYESPDLKNKRVSSNISVRLQNTNILFCREFNSETM